VCKVTPAIKRLYPVTTQDAYPEAPPPSTGIRDGNGWFLSQGSRSEMFSLPVKLCKPPLAVDPKKRMTGMMPGQKRPSCAMAWRCPEAMPVCSCYIFSQIAAKVNDGLSRTKPSCRAVCQIFDIVPNTHIVKNAAMRTFSEQRNNSLRISSKGMIADHRLGL
jgi:hypothetical protein